ADSDYGNQWVGENMTGGAQGLNNTADAMDIRFTAQKTGRITEINFMIGQNTAVATWADICIFDDDGSGNPDISSPESSTTTLVTSGADNLYWKNVTFTSSAPVVAGTVYHIRMRAPNNSATATDEIGGITPQQKMYPYSGTTDANMNVLQRTGDGNNSWS